MSESDDDDSPRLSTATLAVLQEFYSEQAEEVRKLEAAQNGNVEGYVPQENWQLSQFWYNDKTATRLAKEVLRVAGEAGRIACLSSPTLYRKLRELNPEKCILKCLEFDKRFEVFGADFHFYDYQQPLQLPEDWKNSFDIVVADPPFLNEECLCKTALTIRYLAKDKIILCTGAVLEETAKKLLNVKVCAFKPQHANGLQNEFRCYTNYDSILLEQS